MRKYLLASGITGLALLGSACTPSRQPESALPSVSTTWKLEAPSEPSTAVSGEPAATSQAAPVTSRATTTTVAKLGITKSQFDSILLGMSYEEVVAIVGFPGVVTSESSYELSTGTETTANYEFEGTEDFSKAMFGFTNNVLDHKNQFGLK